MTARRKERHRLDVDAVRQDLHERVERLRVKAIPPPLERATELFRDAPAEFFALPETAWHVQAFRYQFLRIACTLVPQISLELNGPLFEAYTRFEPATRAGEQHAPAHSPELLAAIGGWQRRWNLQEQWVGKAVLAALEAHRVRKAIQETGIAPLQAPRIVERCGLEGPVEDAWRVGMVQGFDLPLDVPGFVLNREGWQPMWEDRAEWEQATREAFEEKPHQHFRAVEQVVHEAGARPVVQPGDSERFQVPRGWSPKRLRRALEWLARYQCDNNTKQKQLAKEANVGEQRVSKDIAVAARLIGLAPVDGRQRSREFKGRVSKRL